MNGCRPATVLEPTCGDGAFMLAARRAFSSARILGFDISPEHIERARRRLARKQVSLRVGNFFELDWPHISSKFAEPICVLGNPPWVTNSALGALRSSNLPRKSNLKGHRGLEAATGAGNFDLSEAILLELLQALRTKSFALAMLCKASVARKVIQFITTAGWPLRGSTYGIDARTHFGAAVQAVVLSVESAKPRRQRISKWPVYTSLEATKPSCYMGMAGGRLYADLDGYRATAALSGQSELQWRSGLKHDCAKIMELSKSDGGYKNGEGRHVSLEPTHLFPLLKSSDLAHGRSHTQRRVIVTQRFLGEDTTALRNSAPSTWRYLVKHRHLLDARKSRVYEKRPAFALFGIGPYSFARYKVAISALYKQLRFVVISPHAGQPVMLDDTCYFLPCRTKRQAQALARALNSERARQFFMARVFWDEKRPVNKALLQSLSLAALLKAEESELQTLASL